MLYLATATASVQSCPPMQIGHHLLARMGSPPLEEVHEVSSLQAPLEGSLLFGGQLRDLHEIVTRESAFVALTEVASLPTEGVRAALTLEAGASLAIDPPTPWETHRSPLRPTF